MKPFISILVLLLASPLTAQDFAKGPYANLIQGKFVHAEEPLAKNGLPLWIYGDKKLATGRKLYPLVVVLHGRRNNVKPGEEFTPQAIAKPWAKTENQRRNPCFVVQPYYPPKGGWEKIPEQLDATVAHLMQHLPIDPHRVYLMGFSNGAQGTFQTLARDPSRYAAAITVSGPVDPKSVVGKIKAPIRAWVGENDHDLNKNKRCIALANALKDSGVDIELVVVKGAGHACHGVPTGDPKVHQWLFSQQRPR
ncbi:Alpha/beta hydrolase family protein [Rubripirellula tenax]|uniref:Alpha/beta hydrolase family protein n=1 Tax=Rubripirellula tenax TaxID=2528015 RepID=A0A5C6ERD2_9BACT|nr:dienelactone hydrolase family protein [Rubripirellula tenax]TWU50954.1 Alpha/beta hydrolase family protein [Rubripirellula tenax]